MPRKLLTIVLLAVIAVAALIQTFNTTAEKHRDIVRQELQKILGSDFNFDSLEVTLFRRPGFSVTNIRMADDPRFAATPIIRAKELILGLNLWNLLWGRLVVDRLIFKEPELQIITDETGQLNLTTLAERKKELRAFPRLTPATPAHRSNQVRFSINTLQVTDGRVEYLDRSIPVPAELQVKNINMSVHGFDPQQSMQIRLVAAITEGLNQDVQIVGEIAPQGDKIWSQRGIGFTIQFDSLHVPVIARAIASLRDRFPRALDVTGPMALHARASGTIDRPRIDDITLKIPLFGSSDYNAVATGSVDFSEERSWTSARLQGEFKITSMEFDRLRNLPFLQQLLSPAVVADGPVGLFSRFEGTWNTLRMGVLLVADKGEVRFRNWLHKPANLPARIRARIARKNKEFRFHESELILGSNTIGFTGAVGSNPIPRLRLELKGTESAIAHWNPLFASPVLLASAGRAEWHVVIGRELNTNGDDWYFQGQFKLADGQFKARNSERRIEDVNALITFAGTQAHIDPMTFRVGASKFALTGTAVRVFEPVLDYQLRSDQVNSTDLPPLADAPSFRLRGVSGKGRIQAEAGRAVLKGTFTAANGSFQSFDFRDFRADAAWSGAGLAFSNLSASMFDGTIRSEGRWTPLDAKSRQLKISWGAERVDVRPLVGQLIPPLKNRLDGHLDGHANFDVTTDQQDASNSTLNGSGETFIDRGVIKDFNLVRQVLLRGSGATDAIEASGRLPAGFIPLVNQQDTHFDSIKANFVVENRGIRTNDLVLSTADYSITGAGWIGFDRATQWNGSLILSPRLTQEVQRDYRALRYLLDRRSRLAISFRVDGNIPNVRIRLDSRVLAQLLRGGSPSRDGEADESSSDATNKKKNWLPDALERWLKR
ncbi:MAG TPA: AsmA family protein [Terriglobales bacterium]|nr:AsmA family protein [Terriglobales bacterium]